MEEPQRSRYLFHSLCARKKKLNQFILFRFRFFFLFGALSCWRERSRAISSDHKQRAAEKLYNININLRELDMQFAQVGTFRICEKECVCVCVAVFSFCVYCTFEPLKAK